MFEKLLTEEIRTKCRETLDSLEFWLRGVTDKILSENYGSDYFFYKNSNGDFLINSSVRKNVQKKIDNDTKRYSKPINATTFEELIGMVCNPTLYQKHFKNIFSPFFPEGVAELRLFLSRLIEPRNYLAHSHPISIRQAEQVICYSHDIIDSIKNFYKTESMQEEYNVPKILRIKDSFGNVIEREMFGILDSFDFRKDAKNNLQIGDVLSLEVEVDPSFNEEEYSIEWRILTSGFTVLKGRKVEIKIEKKYVSQLFMVDCTVTSNKDWHANAYYDDKMSVWYKVLPPVK
jgi:uncharacterized protein YxjI